jgi:hypothetical protein
MSEQIRKVLHFSVDQWRRLRPAELQHRKPTAELDLIRYIKGPIESGPSGESW